ncbi:unnamed protein product [Musa acuminata subsp. malaccensis]|uniref:(wild Malaysian banana) hypothetical protein n=1 Tax=Musa acuminata subsp. malaccensis TaxID=214687 RepID=A0A804IIE8_MUSAM|nr:unnamed protein product [Musa acuminata subsp. malaccensis]
MPAQVSLSCKSLSTQFLTPSFFFFYVIGFINENISFRNSGRHWWWRIAGPPGVAGGCC